MNKSLCALGLVLALTACQKQDETKAAEADPVTPVATAPAKTDFTGEFNALGNEPFWSVQIRPAAIALERPEGKPEVGVYVRPVVDGHTARFSTVSAAGHALEVTLVKEPCIDGMSGFAYAYTATVKSGEETLTGCATRPDASGNGDAE